MTIADLAVFHNVVFLFKFLFEEKKRAKYVNLNRWFNLNAGQAVF